MDAGGELLRGVKHHQRHGESRARILDPDAGAAGGEGFIDDQATGGGAGGHGDAFAAGGEGEVGRAGFFDGQGLCYFEIAIAFEGGLEPES